MRPVSCFMALVRCLRKFVLKRFTAFFVVYLILFINCLIWLWLRIEFEHSFVMKAVECNLEMNLEYDKGTGCDIPKLDPFAPEIMRFDKLPYSRSCYGKNWVRCYMSRCKLDSAIYQNATNIECTFRDIIYDSDQQYHYGPPLTRKGRHEYLLLQSDYVFINCSAIKKGNRKSNSKLTWSGVGTGFRKSWKAKPTSQCRKYTLNVMILVFESASKNGFIRKMPKSYSYIKNELNATILNGYNIVGDDTEAALFPILTGKTELELPEARKSKTSSYLDNRYFLFDKLTEDGYRTAYFDDMDRFYTKFNGFDHQPADHYLRSLLLEEERINGKYSYCLGETLTYELLLNLTDQFSRLRGKRFSFTFLSDISYGNFNTITISDNATLKFLQGLHAHNRFDDTLLIIMGDHGPRKNIPYWNIAASALEAIEKGESDSFGLRYDAVRRTIQGRLEERLPFMAIRVPEEMLDKHPKAKEALNNNSDVLTTPHDIYATILHAMDMSVYWNDYKLKGADLKRGLTLFEPIPKNRSCSEAGIEPQWCTCMRWFDLQVDDMLYLQSAQALLVYINEVTKDLRHICMERNLYSIHKVAAQSFQTKLLEYEGSADNEGYYAQFGSALEYPNHTLQVEISVQPGEETYVANMTYSNGKFQINGSNVYRTNIYDDEPICLNGTLQHLNIFCFCKSKLRHTVFDEFWLKYYFE